MPTTWIEKKKEKEGRVKEELEEGREGRRVVPHLQNSLFPENKWSQSQRIAWSVSHVPYPRGCSESQGNILWDNAFWEMGNGEGELGSRFPAVYRMYRYTVCTDIPYVPVYRWKKNRPEFRYSWKQVWNLSNINQPHTCDIYIDTTFNIHSILEIKE